MPTNYSTPSTSPSNYSSNPLQASSYEPVNSTSGFILLQNGGYILLQTGSKIFRQKKASYQTNYSNG